MSDQKAGVRILDRERGALKEGFQLRQKLTVKPGFIKFEGESMLEFYGYKKCSTCKKAEAYLKNRGIEFRFHDITENPPPLSVLKEVLKKSGQPLKKLFNTSGQIYRNLNLRDKLPEMSDEEMLSLLAEHGKLIKRPLVFHKTKAAVGFNPQTWEQIF